MRNDQRFRNIIEYSVLSRFLFPRMLKVKANKDQAIKEQASIHNLKSNSTLNLQALQISKIYQNKSQKTIASTQASQKSQSSCRLKLKDYLYLAQTSASKNALQKRKVLQSVSQKTNKIQTQSEKIISKDLSSVAKNKKYAIKNSDMFQVLKKQIQNQLTSNLEEMKAFNRQFREKARGATNPTHTDITTMVKIKSILKSKMNSCIKQIKDVLQKEAFQRDQDIQTQISMDQQQLRRDIEFTSQIFDKNYLELQEIQFRT